MSTWKTCTAVERDPEKVTGACVFRGTRVPVSAVFENLRDGATIHQFLEWRASRDASSWLYSITNGRPSWSRLVRENTGRPGYPVRLRDDLTGHSVDTAFERGWSKLCNWVLLKQVWIRSDRIRPAGTVGPTPKGLLGTGRGSAAVDERRVPGAAAMCGGGSYGLAGVSTRCARPPLALRPCRVTRRPSLRPESSYGGLDGGVPALDEFTPDGRPAVGAWACRARSRGRGGGRERAGFWPPDGSTWGDPYPHEFQETHYSVDAHR